MTRVTSNLKRLFQIWGLLLLLALPLALATSHCLACPQVEIYLYEDGIPVDETAYYSYSESHLISLATQQIVGYTTPSDPTTILDDNGDVIGYLVYLVPPSQAVSR